VGASPDTHRGSEQAESGESGLDMGAYMSVIDITTSPSTFSRGRARGAYDRHALAASPPFESCDAAARPRYE